MKINKKIYYSFSQINTYKNCPQKYKIIYIDKISNNKESIEAFIGKVVHEVLEWIYKKQLDYYIWDNVENKYDEIWNKNWHQNIFIAEIKTKYTKNYFKRLGLECLRNYYKNNGGPKIDFSNFIGSEVKIKIEIDKYLFRGIIDRIDENNKIIEIHDYKTGKPKQKKELYNDMQLALYFLGLNKVNKNKKSIILNWHFLKESNKDKQHIQIKPDINNINNIKEKIIKYTSDIEKSIIKNKFPAKPNFLCHWCYFWDICDAKKNI